MRHPRGVQGVRGLRVQGWPVRPSRRSERGTLGEEGDVERSARGADAGCARDSTRGRQRRVAGEFFLIGNWTV